MNVTNTQKFSNFFVKTVTEYLNSLISLKYVTDLPWVNLNQFYIKQTNSTTLFNNPKRIFRRNNKLKGTCILMNIYLEKILWFTV